MQYTCTVEIDLPLEKTVALWQDENNFKHWQDGFQRIDHISGTPETVGAKSKIYLEQGKRKMELTETILVANLPTEKKALYEHIHMTNTQSSRFEAIGNSKTQYTSEVEYTKFVGFMPKLFAKLFPGMFRKQSQKWLDQFKVFAEKKG